MQPPSRFRTIVAGLTISVACTGCFTPFLDLRAGHADVFRNRDGRALECQQLRHDTVYLRDEINRLANLPPSNAIKDLMERPCWNEGCLLNIALMPFFAIAWTAGRADQLALAERTLADREAALRDLDCPADKASTPPARDDDARSAANADPATSSTVASSIDSARIAAFTGPARWHPDQSMHSGGKVPPPDGITGRLAVFADGGVVFFERVGTAGHEVPVRIPRTTIALVRCTLPAFALHLRDGTREHFEALSEPLGVTDAMTTSRACALVRDAGTARQYVRDK